MPKEFKIEPDIRQRMDEFARIYGDCQAEGHDIYQFRILYDSKIESPIEQLLFTALLLVQRINNLQDLVIEPQINIDDYRVDFLLTFNDKKLIVECDSQQWHERTEQERRYEKKRDRYFLSKDLKTFHYTGKEILDSPIFVAGEIIIAITDERCLQLTNWENLDSDGNVTSGIDMTNKRSVKK
jgi:very-short-patch-repair endonuclease